MPERVDAVIRRTLEAEPDTQIHYTSAVTADSYFQRPHNLFVHSSHQATVQRARAELRLN